MAGRTLSVRLNNRLGNQMFEYAFARALAVRLNIDQCYLVGPDANRLDCFSLSDKAIFSTDAPRLSLVTQCASKVMGKLAFHLERYPQVLFFIERHFQWMLNLCGLFFCLDGYIQVKPKRLLCKDLYCSGYFQSEQYFASSKSLILKDFTFKQSIVDSVRDLAQQITNCNSVCVHVRLGDYCALPNRMVCDQSYFSKAIDYITSHVRDAHFFIFSDEPEHAAQMLSIASCTIVSSEYTDQQSLYLGSLCRHHIISNSSFSWWMQYLAYHQDQIVVAPKRWMNDDTPIDIFLNHWIRI